VARHLAASPSTGAPAGVPGAYRLFANLLAWKARGR
jgi:hypothetical protein